MKLYIEIMEMNLEGIEHKIIRGVLDKPFNGYDKIIELQDDDDFIKNTLRITDEGKTVFDVRERLSWYGYPLYELKNNEIIDFDYTKYDYFIDTKRRNILAEKIKHNYNPSSENKLLRKTLKKILDYLGLEDESFDKYNKKVENIIEKIPKNNN